MNSFIVIYVMSITKKLFHGELGSYLAKQSHLLTFLTTLPSSNQILNEVIFLISNWLWDFPEGLWKISKGLFFHLVKETS